jgi:hypothetical protein
MAPMPLEVAFAALARADAELLESLGAGDLERAIAGAAARHAILGRISASCDRPVGAAALAAARDAADSLSSTVRAELDRVATELAMVRAARRLHERIGAADRGEPRFVSRRA